MPEKRSHSFFAGSFIVSQDFHGCHAGGATIEWILAIGPDPKKGNLGDELVGQAHLLMQPSTADGKRTGNLPFSEEQRGHKRAQIGKLPRKALLSTSLVDMVYS